MRGASLQRIKVNLFEGIEMRTKKALSPANYSMHVEGIYAQRTKEGFELWQDGSFVGEGATIGEARANYHPPRSYEEMNSEV